jgi:hypothetical protein
MISSEVQRTLVKSPPELWAEVSDPASLARHLGELGEIRITRAEPEKLVEWEAEAASGTVVIKASGWGTKVTLTATRELTHPEPEAAEDTVALQTDTSEGEPEAPAVTAAERFGHEHSASLLGSDLERSASSESETDAKPLAEPTLAPEATIETEPPTALPEPASEPAAAEAAEAQDAGEAAPDEPPVTTEPRRGFFARLFGLGRRRVLVPEPSTDLDPELEDTADAAQDSAAAAETVAAETPEPALELAPAEQASAEAPMVETRPLEPASGEAPSATEEGEPPTAEAESAPADLAAELKAAEEAAEEQVTAILTGVLDRLGAAHHRPFSRA